MCQTVPRIDVDMIFLHNFKRGSNLLTLSPASRSRKLDAAPTIVEQTWASLTPSIGRRPRLQLPLPLRPLQPSHPPRSESSRFPWNHHPGSPLPQRQPNPSSRLLVNLHGPRLSLSSVPRSVRPPLIACTGCEGPFPTALHCWPCHLHGLNVELNQLTLLFVT